MHQITLKDSVPCFHYLDKSELAADSAIGYPQFSILIYPALATKEIVHTCCYFVPLILVTILRKLHIYTTCTDSVPQHCNTDEGQLYHTYQDKLIYFHETVAGSWQFQSWIPLYKIAYCNFIICTPHLILSGSSKLGEWDYGIYSIHINMQAENLKHRHCFRDNTRIVLTLLEERCKVADWIKWLRTGDHGEPLWTRQWTFRIWKQRKCFDHLHDY